MWPFKKKIKYVRAKQVGVVLEVQRGLVVVGPKRYEGLRSTFVQPGQQISKGQVIGKK